MFVVGTAVDGAAANMSVNLMLLLHLVSFSLLAFQLHLFFFLCPSVSNTSSTLVSVLQGAPLYREGRVTGHVQKFDWAIQCQ